MTRSGEEHQPAARIFRARQGRVLGGVCAGLPDFWGLGTTGLRLLFVVTALLGGIGIVVYLACWLVIPAEGQHPDSDPVRSVVLLAWATGALVAILLVAAAAAVATVFGLGWVVFGVAAIVAGLCFSPLRTRIPTVAALLTLGALTLPAVAVALSPLRLTFQSGSTVVHPRTYRVASQTVYRGGFGTLLIDLRHTAALAANGRATLRVDAGLRRTIVALPANACVRVRVNYDVHLFPARLAALLTGRDQTPFHDVVLFGQPYGYGAAVGTSGTAENEGASGTPLLTIDFTSQGGGLFVRDYPDNIDPELNPQWPGFPVTVEPRPYLGNTPAKARKRMLSAWRQRLKAERADAQRIKNAMPGPCAT